MRAVLKSNWISLVMVACAVFFGVANWSAMPERVPSHYSWDGTPNDDSSRGFMVVFLPALALLLAFGIPALLSSLLASRRAVGKITSGVTFFLCCLQLAVLGRAASQGFPFAGMIVIGGAGLLLALGNSVGELERNRYVGVRTPWSLASDRAWRATHRFAGRWMTGVGVALGALAFVRPSLPLFVCGGLAGTLVPAVYSYFVRD